MTERDKIFIASGVAVAVIATSIVWLQLKKAQIERELAQEAEKLQKQEAAAIASKIVKPIYNRNGEITNEFYKIKGKPMIAKADVNIRSTPQVDNPTFWFPQDTNLLAKAKKGTVLGTVIAEAKGKETPAMRWFKLKLTKPILISPVTENGLINPFAVLTVFSDAAPGKYETAWVRADAVTFNQYSI